MPRGRPALANVPRLRGCRANEGKDWRRQDRSVHQLLLAVLLERGLIHERHDGRRQLDERGKRRDECGIAGQGRTGDDVRLFRRRGSRHPALDWLPYISPSNLQKRKWRVRVRGPRSTSSRRRAYFTSRIDDATEKSQLHGLDLRLRHGREGSRPHGARRQRRVLASRVTCLPEATPSLSS